MGLRWGFTVIGGTGYLFIVSWKLTLVMLAVVPIVAIFARTYGTYIRKLSKSVQDALAAASDVAEEAISNIRTVRAFSREPHVQDNFNTAIDETYVKGKQMALAYGTSVGVLSMLVTSSLTLVLWVGTGLVLDGEMTAGVLTSFLLYTLTGALSNRDFLCFCSCFDHV